MMKKGFVICLILVGVIVLAGFLSNFTGKVIETPEGEPYIDPTTGRTDYVAGIEGGGEPYKDPTTGRTDYIAGIGSDTTTQEGVIIGVEYVGRTGARLDVNGETIYDVRVNDIVSSNGQYFLVNSVDMRAGVRFTQLIKGDGYCTTTSGKMVASNYVPS